MLPVKRNSKEFKEIRNIIGDYSDAAGRRRWILLYSLKPYAGLEEAVLLNKEATNAEMLYNLAYDSLHEYIYNHAKKLYRDEATGLYFFKAGPGSKWLEAPFNFAGKIKKQVQALQE